MPLTLVILAAGLGSRYGGDKPLAEVGPEGQSLFEYSVHDAFKAGFKHIVFVVSRTQNTSEFSERFTRYGKKLKVEFVVQSIAAFTNSDNNKKLLKRSKPWGTAHAVLVCKDTINNPFVVINADDYYGQENFGKIARYLDANSASVKTCVLPGYRLKNTLSSSGGVNRGICEVDASGFLNSIQELKNIQAHDTTVLFDGSEKYTKNVNIDSYVSMTFWGFVPAIFKQLEIGFERFIQTTHNIIDDEFYIPDVVNQSIKGNQLAVKMLGTAEIWKGITYADDSPSVRDYIAKLTKLGLYSDLNKL